jgi:hypothetical protein
MRVLGVTALVVTALAGREAEAQEQRVLLPPLEAVARVSTPYSDGSGFLVADSGVVVTNAHVTAGNPVVFVQFNARHRVEGWVVAEDEVTDIALVRVNPDAAAGKPVVELAGEPFLALELGDPLQVVGFPFGGGKTLTRGIVSRISPLTLVTDAAINPGNSGGPMLDREGRFVGVASFSISQDTGPGLGGGVSAIHAIQAIASMETIEMAGLPSADSLQVMPTDPFPLDVLERAAQSDSWPMDSYDISDDSNEVTRRYEATVFTPPMIRFAQSREDVIAETAAGDLIRFGSDLRRWSLDLGAYPPVIIIRITPKTGQSASAFWGNMILGGLAGATGTFFDPIVDPEFKGTVSEVLVRRGREHVPPIEVRFAWSVLNGQAAQSAYVTLSPHMVCSNAGRQEDWTILAFDQERYIAPFTLGPETHAQVCEDFGAYLAAAQR